MKTVDDVRTFWERNPLWSGESLHPLGSKEYFEEHRRVCIDDGFAGRMDERVFPDDAHRDAVLDLGCGPGFWTVELGRRGCKGLVAADLTQSALVLAAQRCAIFGIQAEFSQQNAESMTFDSGTFSHVNCQGVIHHTPNTEACVAEIARVLRPGGTASVSVYYRNLILRSWPVLGWSGKLLSPAGGCAAAVGKASLRSRTSTKSSACTTAAPIRWARHTRGASSGRCWSHISRSIDWRCTSSPRAPFPSAYRRSCIASWIPPWGS